LAGVPLEPDIVELDLTDIENVEVLDHRASAITMLRLSRKYRHRGFCVHCALRAIPTSACARRSGPHATSRSTWDRLGFDTLWTAEHHFQREGYEVFPT